jgi:hypothetical protein
MVGKISKPIVSVFHRHCLRIHVHELHLSTIHILRTRAENACKLP